MHDAQGMARTRAGWLTRGRGPTRVRLGNTSKGQPAADLVADLVTLPRTFLGAKLAQKPSPKVKHHQILTLSLVRSTLGAPSPGVYCGCTQSANTLKACGRRFGDNDDSLACRHLPDPHGKTHSRWLRCCPSAPLSRSEGLRPGQQRAQASSSLPWWWQH